MIRGARQFFELGAVLRGKEIQLLGAMRQSAETHAQQTNSALVIAVLAEQILENSEDVGIELRGLAERFRARVSVETCVTDSQSQRARGQARFTQALASFLRKMAEHSGKRCGVIRIFAKRVIVRNGFGLGIDQKFVGIAAARFAIERVAPLAEN